MRQGFVDFAGRRGLLQACVDLCMSALAWWLAFWLRFNLEIPPEYEALLWQTLPWPIVAWALSTAGLGINRQIWRYTGVSELMRLSAGVVLSALVATAAVLMLRYPNFPRSVLILHPLIVLMMMGAARTGWRVMLERRANADDRRKPVLILGTVRDGSDALRALKASSQWFPVAIVSPDPLETGRSLQGLRVLGGLQHLEALVRQTGAKAALLAAAPGAPMRREALLLAADAGITLMTLPRPDEWLKPESTGPRRIELEDLLGREPVQLDVAGLSDMISGQVVLVTGAAGSIGSELCRQIARFGVARLVCVDTSEYGVYALEQELRAGHPQMQGVYYTASVREPGRLQAIFSRHQPAVVFHAAAYKHVPLMEQHNEIEAVRTNVLGTLHAARAAAACGARRFVMISTDKAVNPTNVMGATKRLAELLVQSVAAAHVRTQFVSVRFGNVLGSSGSVVPLFTAQIARGGPVTVTHPDIVRYFMTIPEAAQLVLQAGLMGRSGQIFVLDMGEPVKIAELARMLIRLSGKTEQEVPISYSGLRPGEKLYEELLADDETTEPTPHPKLRVAKNTASLPDAEAVLHWVEAAGPAPSGAALRSWLRGYVPEYAARDA